MSSGSVGPGHAEGARPGCQELGLEWCWQNRAALRGVSEGRGTKAPEPLCASNDGCDEANEGKLAADRQMGAHFKRQQARQNCSEELGRLTGWR